MRKFFSFRPFIDVLFCCLLMLVAILFLLKTEEEKTKARPPNVIYEVVLTWDGESNDDLQEEFGQILSPEEIQLQKELERAREAREEREKAMRRAVQQAFSSARVR